METDPAYTHRKEYPMTDYTLLCEQLAGFAATDPRPMPLLSNAAALLWEALPGINWAGFYLADDAGLYVGPFQGKPACVHIPFGRGVCGTAFAEERTLRVPDVHAFPGHIACDAASASEIVVPIPVNGKPVGVIDIDSPTKNRFTPEDEAGLMAFAAALGRAADFSELRR